MWIPASSTAPGRSVVSHGPPASGFEPTLEEYFFKRIAPLVEEALEENRRELWPVITLNLDFKTDELEHHQAVWDVLGRYEKWLVTAQRTAAAEIAPLRSAPLLVLTGEADAQEESFHDKVPIGGTLRLFGAAHARAGGLPGARTNYRRWANYPWSAVEPEGQPDAGQWTADDERRFDRLVDAAHAGGLWIRFYTLNGHDPADTSMGWTPGYNFGTLDAVRTRWAAAVRAGVDFVATDQYEAFVTTRQSMPEFGALVLEGLLNRAGLRGRRLLERGSQNASFSTRPSTGGIVTPEMCATVGAISAGDAVADHRPGLIPAPNRISGT